MLILFWQFTIKTLEELDVVSNQHLSIEMFLLRLIYLKGFKPKNETKDEDVKISKQKEDDQNNISPQTVNKETINQIKNVAQEKK